jgi:hypothetical protein
VWESSRRVHTRVIHTHSAAGAEITSRAAVRVCHPPRGQHQGLVFPARVELRQFSIRFGRARDAAHCWIGCNSGNQNRPSPHHRIPSLAIAAASGGSGEGAVSFVIGLLLRLELALPLTLLLWLVRVSILRGEFRQRLAPFVLGFTIGPIASDAFVPTLPAPPLSVAMYLSQMRVPTGSDIWNVCLTYPFHSLLVVLLIACLVNTQSTPPRVWRAAPLAVVVAHLLSYFWILYLTAR